ncbi:DUF4271 domain-containing protein [Pelobium manganitolerans]|nr:DUF4271 domain-containing protein [Pelobium manganitolerans]
MKRFTFLFCLLLNGICMLASAQQDSVLLADTVAQAQTFKPRIIIDSAALARKNFVRDSITYYYLKPDPKRANPWVEKLLAENTTTDPLLLSAPKKYKKVATTYNVGNQINKYPVWFLVAVLLLLTVFGLINIGFSKEVALFFKAFFDNRTLNQIDKEENILVTWHFIFLYIVFSFTVGLFVCLLIYKANLSNSTAGFSAFLLVSLAALVFFGLKVLAVKFMGFLFEVQKLAKEYLNIIYLTYVNALFILLPATLVLTFVGTNQTETVLWIFGVAFLLLIGFQAIRLGFKILLNYRLSKFYLFLYLCTLEICPILLFVKTISMSL